MTDAVSVACDRVETQPAVADQSEGAVFVEGTYLSYDPTTTTLKVMQANGGQTSVNVHESILPLLEEALARQEGRDLRLRLFSAMADGNRRPPRVYHANIYLGDMAIKYPAADVALAAIAKLSKGWYDGQGEPFSAAFIGLISTILAAGGPGDPHPYVYAFEGEIRAEWEIGSSLSQVIFDVDSETATLSGYERLSGGGLKYLPDLEMPMADQGAVALAISALVTRSN